MDQECQMIYAIKIFFIFRKVTKYGLNTAISHSVREGFKKKIKNKVIFITLGSDPLEIFSIFLGILDHFLFLPIEKLKTLAKNEVKAVKVAVLAAPYKMKNEKFLWSRSA